MAGRLAPFIELGVGFNPELTAHENVVLNAVMMGLSPREARRRLDAVLDFAELERLRRPQAEELLVGDVGAARVRGDGAGRRRHHADRRGARGRRRRLPAEVRGRLPRDARGPGKTIVLVTHDMGTVGSFCDRAMLLHDGEVRDIGDPEEVAQRYYRLNFGEHRGDRAAVSRAASPTSMPRVIEAWLDDDGDGSTNVEQGEPIRFSVVVEARRSSPERFVLARRRTTTGVASSASSAARVDGRPTGSRPASACGSRRRIENPLVPGRYYVELLGRPRRKQGDVARAAHAAARLRRLRHEPCAGHRRRSTPTSRRCRGGGRRERRRPPPSCARSTARPRSAAAARASSTSCCLIAVTEFKMTYFGTVLGYLWSLARPLLLFGVLLAVFTPGLPARRRGVPQLSGAAAAQHRPVHLLPGGDDRSPCTSIVSQRGRSSARRSSRGS